VNIHYRYLVSSEGREYYGLVQAADFLAAIPAVQARHPGWTVEGISRDFKKSPNLPTPESPSLPPPEVPGPPAPPQT
jgi:hypothetical protein